MTSKRTKLALITRTRNRNILLERAVQSVLAQTSKDYIHVILNDGGDKKKVEDLLNRYPDKNRKIIHNVSSVGLTPALNQAIRAVDSDYIAIMDDDDTILPTRIEETVKYLDETQAPAIAHYMDRVIEEITDDGIKQLSRERWHEGVTTVSLYKQCLNNYLTNGCVTYRREVYEDLGGYDERLEVAEDWDFGLRLLLKYDVDFLDTKEPLSIYHHRPEQKGDDGNSVFAGIDAHTRSLHKLKNKHLRHDLTVGKLGIGYIMNSLADDREKEISREKAELDKVIRIEGHINHVGDEIKDSIKDSVRIAISTRPYHSAKRKLKRMLGADK